MKTKKLVGILMIFVVITIIIVLCSTLFTVREVSINWLTTSKHIGYDSTDALIKTSGIEKGESIFFTDKEKYTANLEESNPYLKVVKIVTKFPNELEINVAEREEWFAVRTAENNFAVLDDELKILNLTDTPIFASKTNPAILYVTGKTSLADKEFKVGSKLLQNQENSGLYKVLNGFCLSLKAIGYNAVNVKGIIKQVEVNYNFARTKITVETECGLKLEIEEALDRLEEKIVFAFSAYNVCRENDDLYGTITVFEDKNTNTIKGGFVPDKV